MKFSLKFKQIFLKHRIIIILAFIVCYVLAGYNIKIGRQYNSYTFSEYEIENSTTDDGLRYNTVPFSLEPADYIISVTYSSSSNGYINARIDNNVSQVFNFENTNGIRNTITYYFTLNFPTDRAVIDFFSDTEVEIYDITILSDEVFNHDRFFFAIIFMLLPLIIICVIYATYNKNYKFLQILIITAIACIPIILDDGLKFSIDVRDHLNRIQGLYMGLLDGQFPVIVYPNMSNEHGQLGILYPSLFLYIGALLRLVGISLITTYKTLLVIINLATVSTAFYCSRKLFSNEWAITVSTVLYAFDPERLYSLYRAGGALGAGVAAIFFPLIIYGMVSIFFDDKKNWKALAIGFAGIMCSHVVSLILALYYSCFISLLNLRKFKNKNVICSLFKAVGLFLALSIGILVPFVSFFFSDWGKDNLRWTTFRESTLKTSELLLLPQRWFPVFFCISVLIFLFISKKINNKKWPMQLSIFSIVTCVTVMRFFPWDTLYNIRIIDTIMTTIQETHRVYAILAFISSLFVGYIICNISQKQARNICVTIVILLCTYSFCDASVRYYRLSPLLFNDIVGNINSRIAEDYLPQGTKTEWYSSGEGVVSDNDAVNTLEYEKFATHVTYRYTCTKKDQYVEFPLFYYVGYEGHNQSGNSVELIKSNRNKVRINCNVTDTPQTINIRYKVLPQYTLFFIVNIINVLLFIIYEFIIYKRKMTYG